MQRYRSAHTQVRCKRSILLIKVFLLGAKLLLVCYNPLSLFVRFRLVHAGHVSQQIETMQNKIPRGWTVIVTHLSRFFSNLSTMIFASLPPKLF